MRQLLRRLALLVILAVLAGLSPAAIASERILLLPDGLQRAAKPEGLSSLRSTAQKSGKVKVIVGLRVPFAPEGRLGRTDVRRQRSEIAAAATTVKGRFSAAIRRAPGAFRTFESVPFIAMEVTPDELDRLASDPDVLSIVENGLLKLSLAESSPLTEADKAWTAGYTGLGQTIAIIDTGVEKTHPFLAGKVVSEACYSYGRLCPGNTTASTAAGSGVPCSLSGCDHGTHVAGIAAGLGSSSSGVARNASLIAIQVFSPVGGGLSAYTSDIISALDRVFALRNDFKIAAVNLSLGGGVYSSTCDGLVPAMTAAVNNLASAGIATVAASGNNYSTTGMSFPACISTVVSVGAVSDASWGSCNGQSTAADKVACYSNSVSFLSLLAPGSLIRSSVPVNSYMDMNGTSMAAPHVAGAWAVLRQKNPNASNAEILAALQNTGKPITDYRNGLVKKRINVKAAVDSILSPEDKLVLAYGRLGVGTGTVSFAPAGTLASCSESCSNSFDRGTLVTMTAVAAEDSLFEGWSGACSGTAPCSVTMSQAISVSASFAAKPTPPVVVTQALQYQRIGTGAGSVSFAPPGTLATCSDSCSNSFTSGAVVSLTAEAAQGSTFQGWSGACSGSESCTVTMSQAIAVSASFVTAPPPPEPATSILQYTRSGPGRGVVSFSPAGTLSSCSDSCSNSFVSDTVVTLSAAAAEDSTFLEWSGACSGAGSCVVTMSQATSVSARFIAASDKTLTYTRQGAGDGKVTFSSAAGVTECTSSCITSYAAKTRVTLRAVPSYGSEFGGWTGSCKGRSKTCVVKMADAASVSGRFDYLPLHSLNITLGGRGSGTVALSAPDGVTSCGTDCSNSYPRGTKVKLTPSAGPGMAFSGWGGACRDAKSTCTVTLRDATSVVVKFRVR